MNDSSGGIQISSAGQSLNVATGGGNGFAREKLSCRSLGKPNPPSSLIERPKKRIRRPAGASSNCWNGQVSGGIFACQ